MVKVKNIDDVVVTDAKLTPVVSEINIMESQKIIIRATIRAKRRGA